MDKAFITHPADSGQAIGIASIIIQTGIFMSIILAVLKKWEFPFGSFGLMLGLNAILMSVLQDQYRFIPGFITAGLVTDLLYKAIKPKNSNPKAVRLFATLTPVIIYSIYTATIFLTSGTWWSIHLWAGAVVIAEITGFLLSYLIIEPVRGETSA